MKTMKQVASTGMMQSPKHANTQKNATKKKVLTTNSATTKKMSRQKWNAAIIEKTMQIIKTAVNLL